MSAKEPFTFLDLSIHYLKALDSPWYHNLVLLENFVSETTMNFYCSKGIVTMHCPITTGSISSPMGRGSDSKPVKVKIEGVETYLADSMQFALEYGCRIHKDGCYYLMPSFRGEQADERHLCQFYHSEVEIPGNLEDIMSLAEEYIRYLAKNFLEYNKQVFVCENTSHIEKLVSNNETFKKMTFDEVEKLMKKWHPHDIEDYIEYTDAYRNITRKGEEELIERYGVLWITNYDSLVVPFYQKYDDIYLGTARNADLLMGMGETIGCGERHENDQQLLEALHNHEVSPEEYNWYIEMKKRYPMQTSGFGMGVERFLMWILDAKDIRNFQIFPRFNGINVEP